MEIYSVTVYDHTSLGGPMGSERVEVKERHLFDNIEGALQYAKKVVKRFKPNIKANSMDDFNKQCRDLGALGVVIRQEKLNIMVDCREAK